MVFFQPVSLYTSKVQIINGFTKYYLRKLSTIIFVNIFKKVWWYEIKVISLECQQIITIKNKQDDYIRKHSRHIRD